MRKNIKKEAAAEVAGLCAKYPMYPKLNSEGDFNDASYSCRSSAY